MAKLWVAFSGPVGGLCQQVNRISRSVVPVPATPTQLASSTRQTRHLAAPSRASTRSPITCLASSLEAAFVRILLVESLWAWQVLACDQVRPPRPWSEVLSLTLGSVVVRSRCKAWWWPYQALGLVTPALWSPVPVTLQRQQVVSGFEVWEQARQSRPGTLMRECGARLRSRPKCKRRRMPSRALDSRRRVSWR